MVSDRSLAPLGILTCRTEQSCHFYVHFYINGRLPVRSDWQIGGKPVLRPVVRLWILTNRRRLWYDTFRWHVADPGRLRHVYEHRRTTRELRCAGRRSRG